MAELYDTIGRSYARRRRPDPRIARAIARALGDADGVLNVGAGAGSYEPRRGRVVAVEPSRIMIRQRPDDAAPVVQGAAEALPVRDACFDAAMAILTVHHWSDVTRGLEELGRAARERVVLLTFDPDAAPFWLNDYFPGIRALDREILPSLDALRRALGRIEIHDVPIPWDCRDGFLGAWWRRPERYLDPRVRSAISTFGRIEGVEAGVERLRADLASGAWRRRHGAVLERDALDLGYRLIVARAG